MYQIPVTTNTNTQYPCVTTPYGVASVGFSNLNGNTFAASGVIGANTVTSWRLPAVLPRANQGIPPALPGPNPAIPAVVPGPNPVGSPNVSIGPNQMGANFIGPKPAPIAMGANVNGLNLSGANGLPVMNLHGNNNAGANFSISPNMPGANIPFLPGVSTGVNGLPNSENFQSIANHNQTQNWERQPEKFQPVGGWPQMCEVCHLTIASECQWAAHCNGRKHQKKLKLLNRETWNDDTHYYEKPELTESDEEFIVIDEATEWRKCSLCKVVFTSYILEEAHRLGKKHLKKLRAARQAQREGRPVESAPMCDLCNVVFNSDEQWRFHINGKKHIQKWLETTAAASPNKLSAPDNGQQGTVTSWTSPTVLPAPNPGIPAALAGPNPGIPAALAGPNPGIPTVLPKPNPGIPTVLPRPNPAILAVLPTPNPGIPADLPPPSAVGSQNVFIGPKQKAGENELSEPPKKRAKLDPAVETAEAKVAAMDTPVVPEPMEVDIPTVPLQLVLQSALITHVVPPQKLPSYATVTKSAKDKAGKAQIRKSKHTISRAQSVVVLASPSPRSNILDKDMLATTKKVRVMEWQPVPVALAIEVEKKQPSTNNTLKKGNLKKEESESNNSKLIQKRSTKKPEDDTSKIVAEKTSQSQKKNTERTKSQSRKKKTEKKKLDSEKDGSKTNTKKNKSNSEKDGSKAKKLTGAASKPAVTEKTPTLLPHLMIEKKLDEAFRRYSKTTWRSTKHANDLYGAYMKLYKEYDVAYAKYITEFKSKKAMKGRAKK